MLLWHLGATTVLARYSFRDERMDLRFLAVGAILPDLIDTPIGLLMFDRLQSVRLAGHSLLFSSLVMTWILLATRRGRPRKRWMPVAIGMLIHLFLDGMWTDPATLWWPFLGLDFSATAAGSAAEYVADVLTNPWVWAGEAVGLAYLVWLGREGRLGQAEARQRFLATGQIDVAIER